MWLDRTWASVLFPVTATTEINRIADRLDEIVSEAHDRLGAHVQSYRKSPDGHSLPCMDDTTKFRVICTAVKDGKEVWEYEPPSLHDH